MHMTEDEIEQRAHAVADEAAKRMREKLETSTPAELGYQDATAEELVRGEWSAWYADEISALEAELAVNSLFRRQAAQRPGQGF